MNKEMYKVIFHMSQEDARNKVKELDEAINILIRLRESYKLATEKEFVQEAWRE